MSDRKCNERDRMHERHVLASNGADYEKIASLEYWVAKQTNSDEVILDNDQISQINTNLLKLYGSDWTSGYYDPSAVPDVFDREWLLERMAHFRKRFRKESFYRNGTLLSESDKDMYYSSIIEDMTEEEYRISYAVIVKNTPALDLPTDEWLSDGENENALQETTLKINEPVAVLYQMPNNRFAFVVCNSFIGWVKQDCCAFIKTRIEWLEYQNNSRFFVVTKDHHIAADCDVLMGTKLYFTISKDNATQSIVELLLPDRDHTGFLVTNSIQMTSAANLHRGFLPLTKKAILSLLFRELGKPYGWGGIGNRRDCSLFIKDIYLCFGLMFPRNSSLQMKLPKYAIDVSEWSEVEKRRLLESLAPGDCLAIRGHNMMYVGMDGKEHYVISMLHSYVPEDTETDYKDHVVVTERVIMNSLSVKRGSGDTWLQDLRKVVKFS